MSRGGRRRKSRRKVPSSPKPERSLFPDTEREGGRDKGAPSTPAPEASVMEQMHTHTKRLQTLPPDDLELDDLIAVLQSEYGVPPTPQEYRLVIKTPSAEAEPSVDPEHSGSEVEDASTDAPISTSGRRRRRRRSGPPSVAVEAESVDD